MAVSFLGMLATYGLLVWLPTYLTDTFGYSAISAGAFAAIPSVALVLAAPVAGRLADLPGGRLRVVMTGSLLARICYALLAVFHLAGLALVLSALIGASLAATTAPFMLLAGEQFSRAIVSRVVALMAAVAQGGATLAGVLFGVILTRGAGFDTIWIACAILAAARVLLLMSVSGRRAARTPAPG
jgi:MFS family permease